MQRVSNVFWEPVAKSVERLKKQNELKSNQSSPQMTYVRAQTYLNDKLTRHSVVESSPGG